MPIEINEASPLKHLKANRIPLETLLTAFEARKGNRLIQIFRFLQVLVERKRILMDIRLSRAFECPACKKTFASERAHEQHRAAKHPDIITRNEHLSSLGIPLDGKPRRPEAAKMAGAKFVVVTEKLVLDRCPQCGQATLQQIPYPGFFGAPKIRYRCTNPDCGYKDEDTI